MEGIGVLSHTGTLVVGGVVVLAGRLIYDGIKNRRNGNSKYIPREQHDRECNLKLKPINDNLSRIERGQTKIFGKIEDIFKVMPKRNGDR